MAVSRREVTAFAALLVVLASGCAKKEGAAATPDAATTLPSPLDASGDDAVAEGGDAGGYEDTAMPANGEDLQNRMRHLLEAIAQNDPELASDALFPRDAYVTVRDAADPQTAWDKKLSTGFGRSVARLHKRIKGIDRARFVSFELGRSVVQITPKKRDFKKPLWRTKRSKLTFTIDGKTRHLDIAEMTAWRGAWYVTRLR